MSKVELVIMEVAKKNNIKIDFNNLDANMRSYGIDSLAALNLIVQVEEKLGITLDDNTLINIKTLGDLIKAFSK